MSVIVLFGVAVVAIWWQDTPAGSVRDLGTRLIAAGQITGLAGTYLVVIEVLLMGHVPSLDRFIGTDRLAVWHRRNGEYVVVLLVGHAVLTVWGYAITGRTALVPETKTVVLSYPDMLAATVGLALFIVVAVTSARAARRHMRYQTWYFVHLYAYLAIALSFAHQLATGGDFVQHPLNRALWVAMFAVAGALLVWCRLVAPARDAIRHRLVVADVVPEAGGALSVYVTGQRLWELEAEPGQYFLWRFLTRDKWWQAHPFSLSAAPNGRWLRLTAKGSGDFTASLAQLEPGVRVVAEGPFGAFTRHRRRRRKVLLVGGGIGIAPLRALFEGLAAGPGDLTLLYRASSDDDVVFRHELEDLADKRGATIHYLVGSRAQTPDLLDSRHLRSLVADVAHHDVFVCGPPGMTARVVSSLRDARVPRRHIHTEGFEY